ncbi:MAG: 5'/3'-nucleotidase SurE [Spirochaetales bacterium]|nr:5'/3'-nucleotidase SurE [Spirochaetales bacterium]MCF7938376.1 5'/3'-nucleotidase SurE [Spirochaetales bacterium]
MRIVLTNDDGIDSPGLQRLYKALKTDHEVWIVAPDGNRSGVSHSITLRRPVKVNRSSKRIYACDGTPVDCMVLVHHDFIPIEPELVISGINIGPNLGSDLVFSGTLAAARQAAMFGYPSIAVSLNTFAEPFYLDGAVRFIRKNVSRFAAKWRRTHFLNINFPNQAESYGGVELTKPASLTYDTEVKQFVAPDGGIYTFYHGDMLGASQEEGSDWAAVSRGNISLCPMNLFLVCSQDAEYSTGEFLL